ncbi:uncharacterized protein LOC105428417 [Pogonomyrmex barbatus]|uniref:Uncharacterized protein LOC105428417 n=1 Tax=Pogonomyrmex barbatus TaxID=144034 RepID=A0A6I9X3N4_9HYME|nr:uncharacterized protein LOC105428417 [Pogonomyrmex barbatus]
MAWLKILFYSLCTIIVVIAQYTDDSEYDFDFYKDLSTDRSKNFDNEYNDAQDNFYIANGFDDTENQDGSYSDSNFALENSISSFKKDPHDKQFDWYKLPKKVYSYTKYRIPGYDYDEFDYMRSRDISECDDKSVWTHCLCQFTCSKPDVVDCYTPCRSGCECKEEYVFDEKAQRCLLPEECSEEDNYNY